MIGGAIGGLVGCNNIIDGAVALLENGAKKGAQDTKFTTEQRDKFPRFTNEPKKSANTANNTNKEESKCIATVCHSSILKTEERIGLQPPQQ